MKIPQFIPNIDKKDWKTLKQIFQTKWITEGSQSNELLTKLCRLITSKYGVFTPNGTLALYLGLKALKIGIGDKVIVPDITFIASANAVKMTGATPIFVDTDLNGLVDIESCEKAIKNVSHIKAIMPVHLFGIAVNMDKINDFAAKHNLLVIEDACQALGVTWDSKQCGSFGDVGCFSFFADKTITMGEGGLITTQNFNIFQSLKMLRNQGRLNRGSFIHPTIGYNFRITDIQAALGVSQLSKFNKIIKRKLEIFNIYKDHLSTVDNKIRMIEPDNRLSSFIPFRVCILINKAKELIKYLETNGVEARDMFFPLHKQPCYQHYEYDYEQFDNANYVYDNGLCLPTFPTLKNKQIKYICKLIKNKV